MNITLPALHRFAVGGLVKRAKERQAAVAAGKSLNIKAPSVDFPVKNLSGGNQQKVVLAKWLSLAPKVLIFDEPTRGVDVGAKAEVYTLMRNLAAKGVAILMISSDMEEVLGLSDRIAVMHEGHLTGILSSRDATEESVMQLAVGNAAN
jgi:ribose transport system ATP-binding protein